MRETSDDNTNWHPLDTRCPGCDGNRAIIGLSFCATGAFLVAFYCLKCQQSTELEYSMAQCICQSFEADLMQRFTREEAS
jgi:hypothetical protein